MKSFITSALLVAATSAEPIAWKPQPWKGGPGHPGGYPGSPHWPSSVAPSGTATSSAGTATSSTSSPSGTTLPAVDSEALQASILAENLLAKSQDLEDIAYATIGRNRVMGSLGHNNTVAYLVETLEALGDYYTVTTQPFVGLYAEGDGTFTVDGLDQGAEYFSYSPGGNVTAPIIAVSNLGCNASDYPAELDGNIALISRGSCTFGLKSSLAGAAGAAGAIVYNNVPGLVGGGTLGEVPEAGPFVVTLGIAQENGTAILDLLTAGTEVTGLIAVDAALYNVTTHNVIAQTTGGNQNSTLVIGGHSDSVTAGPGINDDGSGIVGLLEVAEQLTAYTTTNSVRFCFWSGEEFGLLGSTYYVSTLSDADVAKIPLYLNFDMIASPNYVHAIYDGDGSSFNISGPPGSAEAEAFFEKFYIDNGLNYTSTAFDGRSDYGPFLDVGVASGGLFTGAEDIKTVEEAASFGGTAGIAYDINYHQAGDNVTNLALDAFEINTKAIAAAVAEYATTFDSLPAANTTTARLRKRSAETWKRAPKVSRGHARGHMRSL
ncbi:Leucyl aminopeptidase yscIV [Elasticomyces elasticus]|nr:Leucyl aminopeptidase yscIV [Elasticomyces elasticus]